MQSAMEAVKWDLFQDTGDLLIHLLQSMSAILVVLVLVLSLLTALKDIKQLAAATQATLADCVVNVTQATLEMQHSSVANVLPCGRTYCSLFSSYCWSQLALYLSSELLSLQLQRRSLFLQSSPCLSRASLT